MTCHNKVEIKLLADKNSAELMIYGTIGESFFDDSVTAKQFRTDLKAVGDVKTLDVRINSPGGSVTHGIAIYEALREHSAKKIVHIDGMAASMASIIAMVGDEVHIADGGFMMIHDPYMYTEGNAADLRRYADMMDKSKEKMVAIYAGKTTLPSEDIAGLMTAETWMTSDEAVEKGFADKISGKAEAFAELKLDNFRNMPQALKDFYAEARPRPDKETPEMAETTKNEPVPATLAELKANCEGADAGFLLEQLEAKATVNDALKAFNAKLKADAVAAKAEADAAKAKKPEAEAKAKPGVEPLGNGKAAEGASVDASEQVEQLVQARMQATKCQRHEAWGHVMSKRPDLRAALVEIANAARS
jgi:ATP-dependent Clp protease, protease subunit